MQLRASQRRPLLHIGRRSEPPDPCLRSWRSWRSWNWSSADRPIMPRIGPSPGRRAPWPAVAEPGAVHHGLDPYCRGIGDSLHPSGRRCLDSGVSLSFAFGLPHGPVVPSAAAICWMAVASAGLTLCPSSLCAAATLLARARTKRDVGHHCRRCALDKRPSHTGNLWTERRPPPTATSPRSPGR